MRIVATLLLIGVLTPSESLFAQEGPARSVPPLVERVEVAVTNVDVTVLDSHGNPVHDLTRDDFEVLEDGVRQEITNFYAIQKSSAASDSIAAVAPASVAAPPPDERFRRRVMVLVDYTRTSKFRRDLALKNLETFIDTRFNGDYDWSVATMDRYIHLILPFTSNHDEIHTTFANVRNNRQRQEASGVIPRDRLILAEASQRPTTDSRNSSLHEANAFLDNADNVERALRAQDTSRAILDAIHSLGALSGKKILMVLTGDLPLDEAVTNFEEMEVTASRAKYRAGDSQRAKVLALLRDRMVAEANAAGVTIFVVNPEGLTVPGFNAGSATQLAVQSFGNSAPVWLSLQTGGQYFPGNSVALSLKQFDERSGNFYSLGYRPSAKSGYHKIAVHIRRAGRYTILARDGYALIDSGVALERALQSGVGVASHPVSLPIAVSSADPRSAGKGNSTVPLAARVALKDIQFVPRAGGSIGRLHVYISIFDDRGRNVGFHHLLRDIKSDDSADGDYTFSTNLLLPAGHYQIAVAMRDEVSDSVGIGVVRISV